MERSALLQEGDSASQGPDSTRGQGTSLDNTSAATLVPARDPARSSRTGYPGRLMTHLITKHIAGNGYLAVFVLMVLESACVPIPSEITMVFGGALASATFAATLGVTPRNLVVVGVVGAVANLIGSLIARGERYAGRPA